MANWIVEKLLKSKTPKTASYLRSVVSGSFYRISDIKGNSSLADIRSLVDTMRALAKDSQVATALSYYATDATIPNSSGDIIWATPLEDGPKEAAEAINALLRKWEVNKYARDHILELGIVGNYLMPTTDLFKIDASALTPIDQGIALDINTISDNGYEVLPSYQLPPGDTIHLWKQGKPVGYILYPTEDSLDKSKCILYPEESIIHFSLGGMLGKYDIQTKSANGDVDTYDIQFAPPLMEQAVQPTQILNLLEDSAVLSTLIKNVRFINVDCGTAEEDEITVVLNEIKDKIEQQMSINTLNGDAQSFMNPQSPNNLIYLPKVNGADAISITDLNMRDGSEVEDKLLQYYQDKKLSVLGIPKEAMNYSSAEGLGGAGAVMSQRSQLYSNSLQRLETAYMNGWRQAFNKYFKVRGFSGFIDKFDLHMQPIITQLETVQAEKRDAAVSQATSLIDMLKGMGVTDPNVYRTATIEALNSAFPQTASALNSIDIDVTEETEEGGI